MPKKPLSLAKLRLQAVDVVVLNGGLTPGEATDKLRQLTDPADRALWLGTHAPRVEGGMDDLYKMSPAIN